MLWGCVWWPNYDLCGQPTEYGMEVHLVAKYCLRKTAQDNIENVAHEVIDTVQKNFYVDDCLKSVQSSCTAIDLRSQLSELLQKGGFRLTNSKG